MIMETFFDLEDVKNRINNDKEYQLVSRFWSANIRFKVEEEFYFMEIGEGKVQKFYRGTSGFDPYDIHIGGPKDVWLKMLVKTPKPFYHDWFAASFHHEFEFGGNLESAYAYYYAILRIQSCMVTPWKIDQKLVSTIKYDSIWD